MNTANTPFSPESVDVMFQALSVMGKGMLGIFIFMLVFYLLILSLEKIYKKKPE
ncbi:MAG TPA: hypothetical protein PKJ08_01975 [Candidatus Cloacimonadota bacterium]|jgi:hypothetical protein|nr:hypothetical protein [Candidatus Cloacimonadota bacterium]HOD53272.1 hypothetical protein [Candidatus Cloacimonadota bacterium]